MPGHYVCFHDPIKPLQKEQMQSDKIMIASMINNRGSKNIKYISFSFSVTLYCMHWHVITLVVNNFGQWLCHNGAKLKVTAITRLFESNTLTCLPAQSHATSDAVWRYWPKAVFPRPCTMEGRNRKRKSSTGRKFLEISNKFGPLSKFPFRKKLMSKKKKKKVINFSRRALFTLRGDPLAGTLGGRRAPLHFFIFPWRALL